MKITALFKASALVGSLMIGMSETRAALIFSENFEDGLGAWTQVGDWSTASFGSSLIAQNAPGANGSTLTRTFTPTSATSFDLSFDFGWLYGGQQSPIFLGVLVTDASNNGYQYNIRQAGDGFSYELYKVTGGVLSAAVQSGTAAYGSAEPLVAASLAWDGASLTGGAGGLARVTMQDSSFTEFSRVVLTNVSTGGGAQSRFDNVSFNAVPEPSSALLLGSAVALGAVLYRRKVRA